tara:strand:- start:83 stop:307 length:225 start_codon:yes stop_codon:yes gene_type:complete
MTTVDKLIASTGRTVIVSHPFGTQSGELYKSNISKLWVVAGQTVETQHNRIDFGFAKITDITKNDAGTVIIKIK